MFDGVHGDGVLFNEAVVAALPGARFSDCHEGVLRWGFTLRDLGTVFLACVVAAPVRGIAGPGVVAAGTGTGAAGPGVGAAAAGSDVVAPGIVFVAAEEAGFPDVEPCPASSPLAGLEPTGHGAVFWPTAKVAEIRNNHNRIMIVLKLHVTSKTLWVARLGKPVGVLKVDNIVVQSTPPAIFICHRVASLRLPAPRGDGWGGPIICSRAFWVRRQFC